MWDIFCKVVDNYGDAGVCWRLSRQLTSEHDIAVRLWIDDIAALARIWPGIDAGAARQNVMGVDIRRWSGDGGVSGAVPDAAVIEAFGCDIPQDFVEAMTRLAVQPAWFNLEYLSAEDWVETHHMLPSPHPRLPLVKYFYYPGFTAQTGGLLREANLLATRDAFRADAVTVAAFWRGLEMAPPAPAELRVSLFAYANPAAPRLFDAWSAGGRAVTAVLPDGILDNEVAAYLGADLSPGETATRGSLRLVRIPFLSQLEYDRLLWACDVNFVRGEDSFVRAQWAARPLVWHIYPQAGDAHRPKLAAFVTRYRTALDPDVGTAAAALFDAWNGAGDIGVAWHAVEPHLSRWTVDADVWATRLASRRDLVSGLAERVQTRL